MKSCVKLFVSITESFEDGKEHSIFRGWSQALLYGSNFLQTSNKTELDLPKFVTKHFFLTTAK